MVYESCGSIAEIMIAKDFMLVAKFILLISSAQSSVNKIDVTVRQKDDRFVDLDNSHDTQIWGLLPHEGAGYTTRFNIGRICDTGTGTVGGIFDPPEGDLPDDSGFPPRSTVKYEDKHETGHSRMIITLKGNSMYQVNHVGAFFVEVVEGGKTIKIIAIKTAKAATIIPVEYTKTASIGDAVTLAVVSTISNQMNLRWRHNGNNLIDVWKGQTNVTIPNVRKADEGIYECYEDHKRAQGVHAIIRLIVRACPDGLYGSGCLNQCQTCYNDGVCEEEIGVCVCPPGFMGAKCEEACGNNNFGAVCENWCSRRGHCGYGHNYFCPPDPVGCSCIAGFHTDSCDTPCSAGFYGADCKLPCHCTNGCQSAEGCNDTNSCVTGYRGPQCQVPAICQKGRFGELCKYMCHCKYDVSCDKIAGTCSNGECADGWGGINNCQQALPALFGHPYVESNTPNASLVIDWNDWSPSIDFGTGPIESYKVYYGREALSDSLETQISRVVLYNMERGPVYHMAISVIRKIGNALFEGILGNIVTARVSCEVPRSSPTITNVAMKSDRAEIAWEVPEGDDWIGCATGIESFTIIYNTYTQTVAGNVRNASVIGLSPCTTYQFQMYANNTDHNGPTSRIEQGTTDTVAPGKVKLLEVNSTSYSSLHVSWEKPDIQEPCLISEYIVTYKLTYLDQCMIMDELIGTEKTTLTEIYITGLEEYSTYEVSVYAASGDVFGEASSEIVTTNENVPTGAPINVQADKSKGQVLTFNWEDPQCGKRNGEIRGYDYKFRNAIDSGNVVSKSTEFSNATFGGLLHDTVYEFQVRANTSEGAGHFTEQILIKTVASNNIVIISLSVAVGFLVLVLVIVAILCYSRRDNTTKQSQRVDRTLRSNPSSPVSLSTDDGYAQYIPPKGSEDSYEDLSVPLAVGGCNDKMRYENVIKAGKMTAEEDVRSSTENAYEEIRTPGQNDSNDYVNKAYATVC